MSNRQFRFGHNDPVKSLGMVHLSGSVCTVENINVPLIALVDIAPVTVPFLTSRNARRRMGSIVDVGENQLTKEKRHVVDLETPQVGHLLVKFSPIDPSIIREITSLQVGALEEDKTTELLTIEELNNCTLNWYMRLLTNYSR